MTKICIDAGHYGVYNRSPAVPEYTEAEYMWRLHLLLGAELEKRGFEVVYTRTEQGRDMALTQRGRLSRDCSLFLSLHSNAVGEGVREDIDYPVAYVTVSGKADGIGRALAECVEKVMNTTQPARIEGRCGTNGDYYGVLRGASEVGTPGVILEHSFHTNTKMTRWLMNEDNLTRLAKAEAEVMAEYFGIEEEEVRYKKLKDIPNNWDREGNPRATIEKLMDAGILNGDGSDPEGNDDVIDLSHDMVRTLILEYRGGAFDRALIKAGFEPAIKE